jgi:transposase-like protein
MAWPHKMDAGVGRRSKFTAAQKAEIVLGVLQRQMTVA